MFTEREEWFSQIARMFTEREEWFSQIARMFTEREKMVLTNYMVVHRNMKSVREYKKLPA